MTEAEENPGIEERVSRPTELMLACQLHDNPRAEMLIEAGENVNARDDSGKTALHHCSENHDITIADMLLDKSKSLVNLADDEGNVTLHLAVMSENLPLVTLLLDRGADIDAKDLELHTALHWATVSGSLGSIEILLKRGIEADTADIHGACAIHYAAQMCGDNRGQNALGLQTLRLLISQKVPVNTTDQQSRTPLIWAASKGSARACRLLVDSGANVESYDNAGLTALHCAASKGYIDCVEVLLDECGAWVNSLDGNKCPPLFYAITGRHKKVLDFLLSRKADVHLQDVKGRSAVHLAANIGDLSAIKTLELNGAELQLYSATQEAPIHEASRSGHADVVEFLARELTAEELDKPNVNAETCMHLAARNGHLKVLEVLRKAGASKFPKIKNQSKSPFDMAQEGGHTDAAEFLRPNTTSTVPSESDEAKLPPIRLPRFRHPVQASVARFEYIRKCNRERHSLRRNLMHSAPSEEGQYVQTRARRFFTEPLMYKSTRQKHFKDSLEWESFHKNLYSKIEAKYAPDGNRVQAPLQKHVRPNNQIRPIYSRRLKGKPNVESLPEPTSLWGIAMSVNECQLEKYKVRRKMQEDERQTREDCQSNEESATDDEDGEMSKRKILNRLADAYKPVNLPRMIHERQGAMRPETTAKANLSGNTGFLPPINAMTSTANETVH